MSQEQADDWTKHSMSDRYRAMRPGIEIGIPGNQDFWGILFARPMAFLTLVVMAGVRWITPNLLTMVAFFVLLGSSALIYWGDPGRDWILAAVLMNVSLIIDCMDGQLARYRKTSSSVGAYLDKVLDYVGQSFLLAAIAGASFKATGDIFYFYFAMLGIFSLGTTGYVKWLAVCDALKKGLDDNVQPAGPKGNRAVYVFVRVLHCHEPDMYFWFALFLCLDKPQWCLWYIGCTQGLVAVVAIIYRAVQVNRPPANQKTDMSGEKPNG